MSHAPQPVALDPASPAAPPAGGPSAVAAEPPSPPPEADGVADEQPGPRRLLLALGLLVLTFASAMLSGATQSHDAPQDGSLLDSARWAIAHPGAGLAYAVALMSILCAHEAGHAVAARLHGVPASLPYFLPLPLSAIGTLGAVIGLRGEVRSRNALVDIAAAGPLAGLAVALPVLAWGIHLSPVGETRPTDLIEGQSLLYLGLKYAVKGELLPWAGRDVQLHPVAFAGWVGLLVTAINLIPVGPLDGGHLAAAAGGPGHDRRSRLVHRTLPLVGAAVVVAVAWSAWRRGAGDHAAWIGVSAGLPWFVWSVALLGLRRLSGGSWPEPIGSEPLTAGRKFVLGLIAVIFVLTFMPWVMREAA